MWKTSKQISRERERAQLYNPSQIWWCKYHRPNRTTNIQTWTTNWRTKYFVIPAIRQHIYQSNYSNLQSHSKFFPLPNESSFVFRWISWCIRCTSAAPKRFFFSRWSRIFFLLLLLFRHLSMMGFDRSNNALTVNFDRDGNGCKIIICISHSEEKARESAFCQIRYVRYRSILISIESFC